MSIKENGYYQNIFFKIHVKASFQNIKNATVSYKIYDFYFFSRACFTWSVQITSEYSVFWWSFQDICLFCFLVWWWSGLVRDRKCLDYFGRQLAKESENNFALLDQYLWREQWTQPFALCEYVTDLSLMLIDILKISSMSSSKDYQTKMWCRIYSIKISTLYFMTTNSMNKSNSVLLFALLQTSMSKLQNQFVNQLNQSICHSWNGLEKGNQGARVSRLKDCWGFLKTTYWSAEGDKSETVH